MELEQIAAQHFLPDFESVVPITGGHINHTYLVTSPAKRIVLQKINTHVFKEPEILDINLVFLSNVLGDSEYPYLVPSMIPGKDGRTLFENEGGYWRALSYIAGGHEVEEKSPDLIEQTGCAFGYYAKALSNAAPSALKPSIPDFHNPTKRFEQFLEAMEDARDDRKSVAQNPIEHAMALSGILNEHKEHRSDLPVRITHNDAKMGNVLFDENNRVLAILDLDTTMPGYLMHDFGDMCRSICNPVTEDADDISQVFFNAESFRVLAQGYLSVLEPIMTDGEILSLLPGIKSIIYVQFLRFLSDYLIGDTYYKVAYADQNLVRAKVQLKLLLDFMQKEDQLALVLEEIVSN
jgi:Ser/Thr protein kinase RdoA (MazF antagonist)